MSNKTEKNSNNIEVIQSKPLLKKLNEYKEFMAILVFFAGGLFWIYGFFATKSQLIDIKEATDLQVNRLTCVMEQNIQMLRGKMEYQYFIDLLDENRAEIKDTRILIRKAKKNNQSFDELEEHLLELKEQRSDLKIKRDKFETNMEAALNKLTKDGCTKSNGP